MIIAYKLDCKWILEYVYGYENRRVLIIKTIQWLLYNSKEFLVNIKWSESKIFIYI